MHPADIKATLTKAGHTQTDVARTVKGRDGGAVTPNAVWLVVQGAMTSAPIARRISKLTGVPVGKLWPGKYPSIEAEESKARRSARQPKRVSA